MSGAVHALPMRRHVTRVMLLACAAVLMLTTGALFTRELLTYRDTALQQLAILARAVASNSTASLAFDNADDARSVLEALRADPGIVAAGLYKTGGGLFASYPVNAAPGDFPAGPPARASYRVEGAHLVGTQPVVEGQRVLGTLFVKADTRAMRQRLILYGQTLVLVIAASAALAWVMSRRLQRRVSAPILALAHAATDVAQRRQYALHMTETNITEIDQLAAAFSAMMVEIQHSETQLRGQLGALNLLQRITHAIGSRQDLTDIFDVVLQTLERDLPVAFAAVAVRADDEGDFSIAALGAASVAVSRELGLEVGGVLRAADCGFELDGRRPLIHEPDTAEAGAALPLRFASAGLLSLVIAPLAIENRVIGLLLTARRERTAFSSPICEFLRQLAEHVALAAHQANLHGALKQAYDDLRQSQHTVMQQERLRALGQMASGIAHDINNAISPVSLYTESLLEREPDLSPRARDYLTTIQRAIEDVAGTVARMREFYRPRETQLTLARIEVNRLVEQVLQLTQARWSNLPQQRGVFVELRKELSPVPLQIMGAEGELRDALTNLLFNAVDAMPDGGVLTVRTAEVSGGEDAWPRVEISVGDTGVGMDEETRRRCLEPFFTTKGERGTGLGLAMVYGAVQRHSAELGIDSEPGRGTVFRLSFAASTDTVPSLPQRHPPRLPPRQRMLLVDDDPVLLRSLTDILEGDGHHITAAGGGQAGIDAFQGALRGPSPFTMVITDLGMPHVDGRRVAAAVKALSPRTPVLMLTGWGQRLLAENDIPPHVDVVLSKPPRVKDLRDAMLKLSDEDASLPHATQETST